MRTRIGDWAARAHMTTGAFYVSVGLALLCSFLAGWNVLQWNANRDQEQRIEVLQARAEAEDEAKLEARKVEVRAQYARCVASIGATRTANAIVLGFKDFLLQTARDTQMLIEASPDDEANDVRRDIIRKRRAQALALEPFPTVTKAQCEAQRDRVLKEVEG